MVLGAAALLGGYLLGREYGWLSWVLMAGGVVLVGTGLIAYCPVWHLLGISTRSRDSR
jgi:hypothetical protein